MNCRARRYRISLLSLNLLVHYLAKVKCSDTLYLFSSIDFTQFEGGAKFIIDSKYLREMVSFHLRVYANNAC